MNSDSCEEGITKAKNRHKSKSGFEWCELVRISSLSFLVSSRQQACRYETHDGAPLAPGHYVALWPIGACRSTYGRELRYLGPFMTQSAARLMQTSAMALGLLEIPVAHVDTSDPVSPVANPLQWACLPATSVCAIHASGAFV